MEASEALKTETEAILTEGGALSALVTQEGEFWTVSAAFPCRGYAEDGHNGFSGEYGPKPYTGNTRRTGGDPRDLALHFVADAAEHKAKMDAFFAPPIAEEPPGQEGLELGAELLEDEGDVAVQEAPHDAPADDHEGHGVSASGGEPEGGNANLADNAGVVDEGVSAHEADSGDGGTVVDATYDELTAPEAIDDYGNGQEPLMVAVENVTIEPERYTAEVEPEAPPQDRFYGLDDLDRRRSLRIGDVVRIGASKIDLEELAQVQAVVVRETVDGVYGGPQEIYDRFVALGKIQSTQAEKVAFLLVATREEVEAFDPEAGWPE